MIISLKLRFPDLFCFALPCPLRIKIEQSSGLRFELCQKVFIPKFSGGLAQISWTSVTIIFDYYYFSAQAKPINHTKFIQVQSEGLPVVYIAAYRVSIYLVRYVSKWHHSYVADICSFKSYHYCVIYLYLFFIIFSWYYIKDPFEVVKKRLTEYYVSLNHPHDPSVLFQCFYSKELN